MHVKVILNPYANRWSAKAQVPAIEDAFEDANVTFEIALTEHYGHGAELAQAAVEAGKYDAVVAAGGDGTVSDVIHGLIRAAGDGPTLPLGTLPLGTGNDFTDMTGIPRDLAAAARVIAAGDTRVIDAGRLTLETGSIHYFDNNSALAMEPMVTLENIKMTRLSGNIRYVVALARALLKLRGWDMTVEWDDGRFEGKVFLLSVCNSARTGGVFTMAPGAEMNDGLLDVVLLPEVSRLRVIALLPRLFGGGHVAADDVQYFRTSRLSVRSTPGSPLHADGEIVSEAARDINFDIMPGKITLLTPA